MTARTYREAGVDISKANRWARHVASKVPGVGGFSGLHPINLGRTKGFLAACTDGVGTKLKLASLLNQHSTVGVDLVAMCVNDLVTCGASPMFFLDYVATGKLKLGVLARVLDGILAGCREANTVLLGGETAQMPGMYAANVYDLAGFAVGLVAEKDLLGRHRVKAGDVLLGLPSSGFHSNGFSLIQAALGTRTLKRLGTTLLTPTRIYVEDAARLQAALGKGLRALAHITGEGLAGNIPRVLPAGVTAVVDRAAWTVPDIFQQVQRAGRIPEKEMWSTFNMGLGMVAVVAPASVAKALRVCPDAVVVGSVEPGKRPFSWARA